MLFVSLYASFISFIMYMISQCLSTNGSKHYYKSRCDCNVTALQLLCYEQRYMFFRILYLKAVMYCSISHIFSTTVVNTPHILILSTVLYA